jgi:hypothetical protein
MKSIRCLIEFFSTWRAGVACALLVAAPGLLAASYKPVVIGGGGFVAGIVFSKAQQNLYYARTDIGGAYRWDSANGTWVPLLDFLNQDNWSLNGVESIAADPGNANIVYLACGMFTGNPNDPNSNLILRSTDKGATFSGKYSTPFTMGGNNAGRSNGERLAVDPNKGTILFMGTRGHGLYKSSDSGATWNKVTSFPVTTTSNQVGINAIEFQKNSGSTGNATPTLYVSVSQTGASIYKSTDGGASWSAIAGQPTSWLPHHIGLDSNNVLYVSYANTAGPDGASDGRVYKLNGTTWTNITPNTPTSSNQFGYGGLGISPTPNTLFVSTIDGYGMGDRVYRSTNGGSTWTDLDSSDTHTAPDNNWLYWHGSSLGWGNWMGDLRVDPFDGAHVMYVTGGGIFDSANATAASTAWTFKVKGLEETGVWGSGVGLAAVSWGGPLFSALGDVDGFRHQYPLDSSPATGQYNPIKGSSTSVDAAIGAQNAVTRTYFSGNRGAVSWDSGGSWNEFGSAPWQAVSNGPGVVRINYNATRMSWAPSGSPVYYSVNNGASWTVTAGGPAPANNWDIFTATWDKVNPNKLYTYDRNTGKVYRSTDGGASMTSSATVTQWGGSPIQAAPTMEGVLWLPIYDGLWKSTDSGSSWTKVPGITSATQVGFGRWGYATPSVLAYAKIGGVWGIYRSTDQGSTWMRVNDDSHSYGWVGALAGDAWGDRYYIGTSGRGLIYVDP